METPKGRQGLAEGQNNSVPLFQPPLPCETTLSSYHLTATPNRISRRKVSGVPPCERWRGINGGTICERKCKQGQ